MSKNYKLAVIGGDGIGPEVVAEGLKVLDAVSAKYGVTFSKKEFDLALVIGIRQVKRFQIPRLKNSRTLM